MIYRVGNFGNKEDKGVKVSNGQIEGNLNSKDKNLVDQNEMNRLLILDPKRRRVDKPSLIGPNEENIVYDTHMVDTQENKKRGSKNVFEDGAKQQTRQS